MHILASGLTSEFSGGSCSSFTREPPKALKIRKVLKTKVPNIDPPVFDRYYRACCRRSPDSGKPDISL